MMEWNRTRLWRSIRESEGRDSSGVGGDVPVWQWRPRDLEWKSEMDWYLEQRRRRDGHW